MPSELHLPVSFCISDLIYQKIEVVRNKRLPTSLNGNLNIFCSDVLSSIETRPSVFPIYVMSYQTKGAKQRSKLYTRVYRDLTIASKCKYRQRR